MSSGAGIPYAGFLVQASAPTVSLIHTAATHSTDISTANNPLRCLPAGRDPNDGNGVWPATLNVDPVTRPIGATDDTTEKGATNVLPIVEGGHLVGLSICPGGFLARDAAGGTRAEVGTGKTISIAVDFNLATGTTAANDALYAVTFVDNAGDIPTLGARFNWHMNVGDQAGAVDRKSVV